MLTEKEAEFVVKDVTNPVELDEFVESGDRIHHDRYAQQSHELPNEAAEASSRALIRVVPLAYGALLGGLADHVLLGLCVGLMLSLAFDLNMGGKSMARALSRGLCLVVARAGRLLAQIIGRLGLAAPAVLNTLRCRGG